MGCHVDYWKYNDISEGPTAFVMADDVRQKVPLKRQYTSTNLHVVTTQNTEAFIII
jgi:hypothetical protein